MTTPTYQLRVVTEFAAAHTLRGYPGSCGRLHGHNWKVEIELQAHSLDATGMALDFRAIRARAREITGRLDHRYLNEFEPFTECNPTAENVAAHCFRALGEQLNQPGIAVQAVTVWENDRACVRYTEGEA
jgi:6-pyruvoyltetrahydropterin/6-carboxytetrahydropterin synthase